LNLERLDSEYVVGGAGPAGLTVARLLALKGRKVVVVDPDSKAAKRLELLAPASLGTVAAVGLAPLLDDPAIARPCLGIRRQWDTTEPVYEDFLRHPHRIGYVVDRSRFDDRLRIAAAAAGVEFWQGRATGFAPDGRTIRIQMSDGRLKTVSVAGTIVDATGRGAIIARRKGARVAFRDRMVAELVEEAVTRPSAKASRWLDVQKDGSSWSYRIQGPGGLAQTWRIRRSTTEAIPNAMLRVDASSGLLSQAAGNGWIAVGDAAIAFDPIASQGLFNALSSAQIATGALLSADGLSPAAARLYSSAVAATFYWSEAGRSNIYNGSTAIN
jgi:flavin-dependent dehydrogenase